MSTAPNDIELFNFTERFEQAAKAVIIEALGKAAALPGGTTKLSADRIGVEFQMGAASDLTWRRNESTEEYFKFEGCTLKVEISFPREDGAEVGAFLSQLAQYCATIRAAFSLTAMPFKDERLQYYRCFKCKPAGEQRGYVEDQNTDICTMTWDVSFFIQPDAWPVLPTG